jgi:hypothetical protein
MIGRVARLLHRLQPTLIPKAGNPPNHRSPQIGNFRVSKAEQILGCQISAVFLADMNGGRFKSKVAVHRHQRYVHAHLAERTQIHLKGKMHQDPRHAMGTQLINCTADPVDGCVSNPGKHYSVIGFPSRPFDVDHYLSRAIETGSPGHKADHARTLTHQLASRHVWPITQVLHHIQDA